MKTTIKEGDIIRVPRDTEIQSYNPKRRRRITKKAYTVKCSHIIGDYIYWTGSSYYWVWTRIANVSKVAGDQEHERRMAKLMIDKQREADPK